MEYELNEDGTLKLDDAGNPIPKASSQPEPNHTIPTTVPPVGTSQPSIPTEVLQMMKEQGDENRRLAQELADARKPVTNTEDLNDLYYKNPSEFFEKIVTKKIADAVDSQVAPLNAFVASTQKDAQINNAVTQLGAHPHYSAHLSNPVIRAAFMDSLRQVPQLTNENVILILNNTVGRAVTGQLPGYTNTPTPVIKPVEPVIPGQLPPSPPKVTPKEGTKINLTESERKMARFYGMTDEEYHHAQNASSRAYLNEVPK